MHWYRKLGAIIVALFMVGGAAAQASAVTSLNISYTNGLGGLVQNGDVESNVVGLTVNSGSFSGVARVDYLVDGVVANSISTSPYNYPWGTLMWSNASHTLAAKAYDSGGELIQTSATLSVTVDNAPLGAIGALWSSLGGENGFLGHYLGHEFPVPGMPEPSIAKMEHFVGGDIYWSPATGAHELHGAILAKYNALGGPPSFLGFPVTNESVTPDGVGRYNHFEGGSIYWTPNTGAHEVHGAIRAAWAAIGWERSVMGYPASDEAPATGGSYNNFQGGAIVWSEASGAHETHGAIRAQWAAMGFERGPLGFPITNETPTPTKLGAFNHFQGGSIYWSPATGAHEVYGAIRSVWAAQGWENGRLGFPTSGEFGISGGGRQSNFQGGYVTWTPSGGVVINWW
jgi:uncharacterized protein with LGFP repeats